MEGERTIDQELTAFEERIDWVLSHPRMSDWLKHALRSARDRNPSDILNDLAMIEALLRRRAELQIEALYR